MEKSIGQLEIYVHQARNIRNICIYQNQDVYAKIFLKNSPQNKISTKVVNGGGQNPVFNESLRLDITTMDSSLRCEIWMMSRIKNYLQDQLLGFLLLPLSDAVSECGKPAAEFELSSNELFHSPAGFVELSFHYSGIVMEMSKSTNSEVHDHSKDICCELDKIEFPDLAMANEHKKMVSEYFDDDDDAEESHNNVEVVEFEDEEKVVQKEIVDIYMKSMQQFTDALAKMKLPMDDENGSNKLGEMKGNAAARVFYGSRAFF